MSWRLGGLTGQVIFVCGVPGKEREVSVLAPKLGTLRCHEVFKEHHLFDSPGQ